jgi:polyhydroxybutyrate depolymerase
MMKKIYTIVLVLFTCYHLNAQTIQKYIYQSGVLRSYLVHLPPGFNASSNLPLVFNLHGATSSGAQQEFYSRMSETADANNFIVAYPDGINNVWNSGFSAPYSGGVDDVGFISMLIDTISSAYHIDLNRVYSCGMSNGGYQSFRLACDLENRIAAIASVTGEITSLTANNCVLSRNIPVMIVHGTADPVVDYNGAAGSYGIEQTISFWLNKNQCSNINDTTFLPDVVPITTDSSTVQKIHYRTCASGVEVLFYKIIDGGHTWPNAPFHYIFGPTNEDIDGSTEVWNFFKRFTLNGATGIDNPAKGAIEANLFPNPSSGIYELKVSGIEFEKHVTLSVFDYSGRTVRTDEISHTTTYFNFSELLSGIYLMQIQFASGVQNLRFVKQ